MHFGPHCLHIDRTRKPVEATAEEQAKLDKKKAALTLLQKNFPQTASGRAGGSGSESSASKREQPVKASSKTIVVLKLKQNAKPLDPSRSQKQVLSNDRRYFFGNTASTLSKKPLWLPKVCLPHSTNGVVMKLTSCDTVLLMW